MIDKLDIIRQILETDPETDEKILALIESSRKTVWSEADTLQTLEIPTSKVHIEEREHQRKAVVLTADINTGKERITARAEDVSLCGAFICTEKKIAKGQEIAIRLISPEGGEFAFISEVVRVDQAGIGVLIKTINGLHQERFRQFVGKL